MNVNLTALNMSHLISSDAPLSPLSDWEQQNQYSPVSMEFGLNYNYSYPSPPRSVGSLSNASPIPVSRVLRGRMSPDSSDSEQQLCLPTHQVFDMSLAPSPEPLSSPPAPPEPLPTARCESTTRSVSLVPSKRSSSLAPSTAKKPRASAISVKDFVPPDVTGLSKREARLVKNRAAAFLSRQRKREEFETMEQRVAELEQENARLLELAQRGSGHDGEQDSLVSEVEQLRSQLAAAEQRERELNEELSRKASQASRVKTEAVEPQLSFSSRNGAAQVLHKSGASLGLMVLLCALPSLVSLPPSGVPTTFSLPLHNNNAISTSSSAFDMRSFASGEFDWLNSGGSVMDVDANSRGRMTTSNGVRKLEFVDSDSEALGLSGLDISFDATPSHDGKIRVRIHPPASSAMSDSGSDSDDQSMSGGSDCGSSDTDSLGPFLGIGADYGMAMSSVDGIVFSPASGHFPLQPSFDLGYGQDFGLATSAGRRRVRIALKSLPGEGREGGEWEVQVC